MMQFLKKMQMIRLFFLILSAVLLQINNMQASDHWKNEEVRQEKSSRDSSKSTKNRVKNKKARASSSTNSQTLSHTDSKCKSKKCRACIKHCCGPHPDPSCTVTEMCVTVPKREDEKTLFFGEQSVPAANIFVRIIGDLKNPIVFFCHDTNFSCDMWLCQQNFLCSQGYCTIAIDLRGHGRSNKTPANPIPLVPPEIPMPTPGHINYVYETFANDIQSVLTQLGVKKPFAWVGVSDGSSIGIKYFSMFNHKSGPTISKLFLLDPWRILRVPDCAVTPTCIPNQCVDPVTHNAICFPQAVLPEALGIIGDNAARNGTLAASENQILFPELCKLQLIPVQAYIDSAIAVNVTDITLNFFNTEFRQDLQSIFSTIDIPVGLGYGSFQQLPFSIIQTVPEALYVAQQIPGAKLIQFTGKGFFPHMTAFMDVNNALFAFLQGQITQQFTLIPDTGCQICPSIGPVDFSNQCPPAP